MAEQSGVDLSRKFVSESEIEERKRKRQEEWEKVRKPEDPEDVPEEPYDSRSLYVRLQEQKEKKQEEFEEQFKFKNMVRGLDEEESKFLDEVSRQQSLLEKQRHAEELHELQEYRSARTRLTAAAGSESCREAAQRARPAEHRSMLSQAHLLAGAVKRRSSTHCDDNKKIRVEESDSSELALDVPAVLGAAVHLPSAAVCVGILPGLGAYSGSSDSDSSSDSEV